MRVLYFSRDYTTHDRRFLDALVGAGHETFFLRLEDDGFCYESRPVPAGVRVVAWAGGTQPAGAPSSWDRLIPEVQKVVADVAPDVVHAGPVPSCGYLAARAGCTPLVVMSWGSDLLVEAQANPEAAEAARYALRRAGGFVCDCDAVRQAALALAGSLPEVVQFPWGVDLDEFRPSESGDQDRSPLGLSEQFVVVSTRLWEPHYGILTVLEAAAAARTRVPNLHLLLLGDGSQRAAVADAVRQPSLQGAVTLPGLVSPEALAPYFRAADVYLSCAHSDGTSISLLEAMACGLPVVATDIAGNREWLDGLVGDALVPVGDAIATADALVQLASVPRSERRALGASNRRRAVARANWQANVQQLFEAYARLAPGAAREPKEQRC